MENEVNAGTASSSRWNPTKDQITLLENLYKEGIRTPSADQIQQITGRLRAYGHIEVGCVSPYYLQQASDHHMNQHGSVYTNDLLHRNNVMIPSGGYEKRTVTQHQKQLSDIRTTAATRMPISPSSLRFDRFALRDNCYAGEDINVNSSGRKTLPLFPLQPLNASNADGMGSSSFALGSDSPVDCSSDGAGREQPFIDFFSGGSTSTRFDSNGNGL
ncbi:unnamed protein product [Arabidopsis thaliana]|uniref:Uncharacterized protein n=1 Tax=Arabidopsis thaliana TaxID=3702 RepID=A0A654GCF9_ARATH|nr:unnamed protein product [Arabidopsis thaliana]VYS70856.1 unnamed protein product [Arabidopsis thaliana]